MSVLTFADFAFRASHSLPAKQGASALPHWHSYVVRFWFTDAPDQDALSEQMAQSFKHLHGSNLNDIVLPESTDEALAQWFLEPAQAFGKCIRVRVTNDGRRGAEASK